MLIMDIMIIIIIIIILIADHLKTHDTLTKLEIEKTKLVFARKISQTKLLI